ncbi:hypothetical protein [Caulobacter sp. 17J80-11]|uniref:hypothetical protein n=1 Tax=Caulobacter sp. 17J80-11 TaxID=2763502 RepID=UPI0016535B7E|nr:hypothetical protein [Caulobacter sp. 17J80-11]MBC6983717.1 hypothetical protein [Caulobacter sp. 17J80-11]
MHRMLNDDPSAGGGDLRLAAPPQRLGRLALITPWDDLCGIAAYSRHLRSALEPFFDIEVLELDGDVLRSSHPRLMKLGDAAIEAHVRRLKGFDYVNLQLEHGTLGERPHDIHRRFVALVDASPNLTVTFHTVLSAPPYPLGAILGGVKRLNPWRVLQHHLHFKKQQMLAEGVYAALRRAQRDKPVKAVVHTQREWKRFSTAEGLAAVHHHPLAFLGRDRIAALQAEGGRHAFPALAELPPDAVVIGVFGFISGYKNFDFVIQALRYLPANVHLAVFGGVNLKGLKEREARARDLEPLFAAGRFDEDFPAAAPARPSPSGEPQLHPANLMRRVHFLGAMNDDDFFRGMVACDLVAFPYQEVGQTSSGPISQAVELGCRVLAARTHAFTEFGRYHPERIEFYDVGNLVEFVEKARLMMARPKPAGTPAYHLESAVRTYVEAITSVAPAGAEA